MIKTRFAPSPTGLMHLGSLRAALLSYLFAKKNHGIFLLRIDDTDVNRSKLEFELDIKKNLNWMQITYDYEFKQSDRTQRYNEIFELLKSKNLIYECFETQEELETIKMRKKLQKKAPIITKSDCIHKNSSENSYWRFDLNANEFKFTDIIQGNFTFKRDWSDPVIRKPDGGYTYTFVSSIELLFKIRFFSSELDLQKVSMF